MTGEFEKDPGATNQLTHAGIEAVYNLARIGGIDVAAYGEYELGFHGDPDGVEAKLLLERRTQNWDLRFNLVAEKPLDSTQQTAFGYAASADFAVGRDVRLGATAFGDYAAGSNHVLPTGGSGRFTGPLGPGAFRRRISVVSVGKESAAALAPSVDAIARAEGFPVHGESAMIRR